MSANVMMVFSSECTVLERETDHSSSPLQHQRLEAIAPLSDTYSQMYNTRKTHTNVSNWVTQKSLISSAMV